MGKTIRLADVARKSKVSLSTASLALRNKPGIPPETRERVFEVARDLGYRPRYSAQHLATALQPAPGKLHTVGLIIKTEPDLQPHANPFYSHVLAGIEDVCRQRNINLLYTTLPADETNQPMEIPTLLQENQVDGYLLVGTLMGETLINLLDKNRRPVMLVDAYALTDTYDMVVSDNFRGAYQAVKYLLQHGHRQIGFVGSATYPSLRERRQGYQKALAESGITETYFVDCPVRSAAIQAAVPELLRQQPHLTALVGCNDHAAIATIQTIQSLGRRVPEELSVVGFDDIDLAQHITPPLTTMHVDKISMGRLAVLGLIKRGQFPEMEQVSYVVQPHLIERQSVAQVPDRI